MFVILYTKNPKKDESSDAAKDIHDMVNAVSYLL